MVNEQKSGKTKDNKKEAILLWPWTRNFALTLISLEFEVGVSCDSFAGHKVISHLIVDANVGC
jgi:hypothetical protein